MWHLGQQPAEEELLAACQRAEQWLWLATAASLAGDGADVEAAHVATTEMAKLLPTYAAQERGDGREQRSNAAATPRGDHGDRSALGQRFYLGALEETEERRADGTPRRRAQAGRCQGLARRGRRRRRVLRRCRGIFGRRMRRRLSW